VNVKPGIVPASIATFCVLSGALGSQLAAIWPWSSNLDAVAADPEHHRVLFEDDNVRILEVSLQPGAKESSHTHQWSSVFLIDSFPTFTLHWQCSDKDRCLSGKDTTISAPAGAAMPVLVKNGPAGPHYSTNDQSVPFHAYKVEYKKLHFTE
jgi:hypothetical protein